MPATSANDDLLERGLRRALAFEGLKKREAAIVARFVRQRLWPRAEIYLREIVSRVTRSPSAEELAQVFRVLAEFFVLPVDEWAEPFTRRLFDVAEAESAWQATSIGTFLQDRVQWRRLTGATVQRIIEERPFEGRLLREWFGSLSAGMQDYASSQVRIGLLAGESLPQLTARLRPAFTGSAGAVSRQAQAVARTALQHVMASVHAETYAENKDIVKYEEIVATLDARTTDICKALDGRIYKVGEGPRPPFHFQCRTVSVPVLRKWNEIGIRDPSPSQRAALTGALPEKVTYGTWLRRQSHKIQDLALGKQRAALFRAGKLEVTQLVNRFLRPLRLEEIEALIA